jgi:hypothetical protein
MHGHVIIDAPKWTDQGFYINTGCGFGGYLTETLIEKTFDGKMKKYILVNFIKKKLAYLK